MLYPVSESVPGRPDAYGYINRRGDPVVPFVYSGAGHFFEGKTSVINSAGKSGFIGPNGELQIEFRFSGLGRFHCGVCSINGGYITHSGDWLIEPRYLVASPFSEGLAFATIDGEHFGYINHQARFVIPPKFLLCRHFSEGLAAVSVDERWGYIGGKGEVVIPTVFEGKYATGFRDGMAGVRIDGKCGFIDRSGNFVIKPKYDDVRPFSEGAACVKHLGKWGLIDDEGRELTACRFDVLGPVESGIASALFEGKAGFVSREGDWLIQPVFDQSYNFFGGMAVVRTGVTYSYIDKRGQTVWASSPNALTKLPPTPLFV